MLCAEEILRDGVLDTVVLLDRFGSVSAGKGPNAESIGAVRNPACTIEQYARRQSLLSTQIASQLVDVFKVAPQGQPVEETGILLGKCKYVVFNRTNRRFV
jgi:hypothetical protein